MTSDLWHADNPMGMKNPFTLIADERKGGAIDRWLAAKAIADESSGWDLVVSDDEWGIYTVGEIKELGRIAGLRIDVVGIDLAALLSSDVVTELFDDEWIAKIKELDQVYVDLLLDYIESLGLRPEACIRVSASSGSAAEVRRPPVRKSAHFRSDV